MPFPTVLPPVPTNQSGAVFTVNNVDDAIAKRTLGVIVAGLKLWPSRYDTVDLWHPEQPSRIGATAPAGTLWFRIAENVQIAFQETHERFFQERVGVIERKVVTAVIPLGFNLDAQDTMVRGPRGDSYTITDVTEQSGVENCKVTKDPKRFTQPNSSRGTSRLCLIGGFIS